MTTSVATFSTAETASGAGVGAAEYSTSLPFEGTPFGLVATSLYTAVTDNVVGMAATGLCVVLLLVHLYTRVLFPVVPDKQTLYERTKCARKRHLIKTGGSSSSPAAGGVGDDVDENGGGDDATTNTNQRNPNQKLHFGGNFSRTSKRFLAKRMAQYPPAYPNGWFKLCDVADLARGNIVSISALGMDLVVFQEQQQQTNSTTTSSTAPRIGVINAHCPHLGAHLGFGKVVGSCIQCPFHGWEIGSDGRCKDIPYYLPQPAAAATTRVKNTPTSISSSSTSPGEVTTADDSNDTKKTTLAGGSSGKSSGFALPTSTSIPKQARVKQHIHTVYMGMVWLWFHADDEPPQWSFLNLHHIERCLPQQQQQQQPSESDDKKISSSVDSESNGTTTAPSYKGRDWHRVSIDVNTYDMHITDMAENGADFYHFNFLHSTFPIQCLERFLRLSFVVKAKYPGDEDAESERSEVGGDPSLHNRGDNEHLAAMSTVTTVHVLNPFRPLLLALFRRQPVKNEHTMAAQPTTTTRAASSSTLQAARTPSASGSSASSNALLEKVADVLCTDVLFTIPFYQKTYVRFDGPSVLHFDVRTPIGNMWLVKSLLPIEPFKMYVEDVWFAETRVPRFAWTLMTKIATGALEQDRDMWENRLYLRNPVLVKGDGPFMKYRRWFNQFYSESSEAWAQHKSLTSGINDW